MMTTTTLHPLAADYLDRVDRAARRLPRGEPRELVEEISGWIAGVILLWSSRAWNTRDKVIGTLIVPGGLASALIVGILTGTKRKCVRVWGTRLSALRGRARFTASSPPCCSGSA